MSKPHGLRCSSRSAHENNNIIANNTVTGLTLQFGQNTKYFKSNTILDFKNINTVTLGLPDGLDDDDFLNEINSMLEDMGLLKKAVFAGRICDGYVRQYLKYFTFCQRV